MQQVKAKQAPKTSKSPVNIIKQPIDQQSYATVLGNIGSMVEKEIVVIPRLSLKRVEMSSGELT